MVNFRELNFMEPWPFRGPFDIIFCRNVLIYFDKSTQMWVIDRFGEMLREGGHLVIGHSETLRGRRSDQFQSCGKNIFRRSGASKFEAAGSSAHQQPRPLHGFDHLDHYWDAELEYFATKIRPGEYYVTRDDEVIETVVGSCISVCVGDPVAQIGGMNHFLVPVDETGALNSYAMSHGMYAMEELVNAILKLGKQKHRLEVKFFGGAEITEALRAAGEASSEFVKRFLVDEGLIAMSQDVGGSLARKVCYYPKSGRVKLRKLEILHNATIPNREQQYFDGLHESHVIGDIEIF